MPLKILVLAAMVAAGRAPPVPGAADMKVLYDQRQEGEWNVRADLKNFVILIIPTPTSTSAPAAGGSLLDFLTRAVPRRPAAKRHHHRPSEATMHFIESKTAPYHVDISKTKSHLARLHPANDAEVVVAQSPAVTLVRDERPVLKAPRAYVVTIPDAEKFVLTKPEDDKKIVKKDEGKNGIEPKLTNVARGEGGQGARTEKKPERNL